MTNMEQRELRSYCAFLMKEYGFSFTPNDPVIPALYIIHKEMELNNDRNKAIALEVEKVSSKVNPKVFQFNSPGEAWRFQLGIALKWVTCSIPVIAIIWIAVWYWSMEQEIERARAIITVSNSVSELLKRVERNDQGYFFIDFTAAGKDSIRHYTEFRKLNSKTVRVFVGKVSQ